MSNQKYNFGVKHEGTAKPLAGRGYNDFFSLEWEKCWNPKLISKVIRALRRAVERQTVKTVIEL